MIYFVFCFECCFSFVTAVTTIFFTWVKVTMWKFILSRQLERELQKWTLPKAQGPGSWVIKHSAQVKVDKSVHCTLLSTFTWCQQPRQPLLLLQQAGTALISSQAGHIIQIVYIQTQCNVFVCLQFECNEVKVTLTHHCISTRSTVFTLSRDRKIESRYWHYWHIFRLWVSFFYLSVVTLDGYVLIVFLLQRSI